VCREYARLGLRDQKIRKRVKDDKLEPATTTLVESCSSARARVQNLSSPIKRNRKKIDNRSRQRNWVSVRPMNVA
jgi:hypothetical protein